MAVAKKRHIRRSVGFDKKEMEGYFMIANKDAAIAIINKLTGSQLRLWLYLMMVDSFADLTTDGEKVYHSIPSPQEIAIKIGVSPETVEKDMRKLKKLGLYEYRITAWQGHNLSAAKARGESERLKKKKAETKSPQGGGLNKPPERLNKPPERLNKPPERLNKPPENPEPLEKSSSSDSPQTIQTYSDFKRSLSESARENFFSYVKEQTKNLAKPINDLEAWLASKNAANQNRWEVYYQNYQNHTRFTNSRDNRNSSPSRRQKIAEWQEYLRQEKLAAEKLREKSRILQKSARKSQTEHITEQNNSEQTTKQNNSKQDEREFDQILNNPRGCTKNPSLSSPQSKTNPSSHRKINRNQGRKILRDLDLRQRLENNPNPDLGGES